MIKRLISTIVALAILALVPVNAATMQATYTGTITTGLDSSNFFGLGTSLDGSAYTATFIYDTNVGAQSSPIFDQVFGGSNLGTQSPMLSASLTINGIVRNLTGLLYGQATVSNDGTISYLFTSIVESASAYLTLYEYRDDALIPRDILAPFNVAGDGLFAPGFTTQGLFSLGTGLSGELAISTASVGAYVTGPTPVPLPAAMPILLAALTFLGVMTRRRRSTGHGTALA